MNPAIMHNQHARKASKPIPDPASICLSTRERLGGGVGEKSGVGGGGGLGSQKPAGPCFVVGFFGRVGIFLE